MRVHERQGFRRYEGHTRLSDLVISAGGLLREWQKVYKQPRRYRQRGDRIPQEG